MKKRITRILPNGNRQTVHIPDEFRLDADRVQISRNEQGDPVIHPPRPGRGEALLQALRGFDDDFIKALETDRQAELPLEDRDTR